MLHCNRGPKMYVLSYELRCTTHCASCVSQHELGLSYVAPLTVHILPLSTSYYFFTLRHFIMSYVTGPDLPYSSILFHKLQYYRERVTEHELCAFSFATTLFETFLLWKEFGKLNMKLFMLPTRYFCYILIKIEFSRQIHENHSNIKFHENRSSRCRILTDRRTGGRTDR